MTIGTSTTATAKGSPPLKENNRQTDILVSKERFNLDEDTHEIYILNWKSVLVYEMRLFV